MAAEPVPTEVAGGPGALCLPNAGHGFAGNLQVSARRFRSVRRGYAARLAEARHRQVAVVAVVVVARLMARATAQPVTRSTVRLKLPVLLTWLTRLTRLNLSIPSSLWPQLLRSRSTPLRQSQSRVLRTRRIAGEV